MAMTTIDGVPIHFFDSGDAGKPPLALIHGFPLSSAMWEAQVAALKGKARLIAYDVRGHGRSGAGDGQYSIELFVDDLFALLDHLKIAKAALCGLSMGGYIALRAVERAPERVGGLVLCDTRSEADSNESKLKRAEAAKAVKRDGSAAFAEKFAPSVFSAASLAAGKPQVALVKRLIAAAPPIGVAGALLAMAGRTDTTAALARIAAPTLVIVGELDALTPPSSAKALADAIPGAELAVIPGAGHLSNLDQPELFNELLAGFLACL